MTIRDSRLSLLFLCPRFPPHVGGAELQAARLAEALVAGGDAVDVLTTAVSGAPAFEVRQGVRVFRRVTVIPHRVLWGASSLLGSLRFLLRRGRWYDGFLGFGFNSYLAPPALLWQRRGPLVIRCVTSPASDLATCQRLLGGSWLLAQVRRSSRVVALTPGMARELETCGFDPARICVIPSGVDLRRFGPSPATARDATSLVYVGRLHEQKGLPSLLEAFSRIAPARPGLRLELLGEGPERPMLAALAAARGVSGRVSFRGAVAPEAVREALARAAVVVHPSLQEGLSNALLEAMACGSPIVASDIPANRELLGDSESGLLVPADDPVALAGTIERVLDDPGLARLLGAAAARRAKEQFSLDAAARSYRALFRAIARPGSASRIPGAPDARAASSTSWR